MLTLPATGAGRDVLPAFSWDTVPVCIHFGKFGSPLSAEELNFVADHSNLVCLEKGHGKDRSGSSEKGIAYDAERLKARNPEMKVLFYWNAFLNYRLYDACDEVAKHPEWIFRDKKGDPLFKSDSLEQYNVLNPEFRQWWAGVAGKGLSEYNCDGIFMDALNQPTHSIWMKKGWGEGKEAEVTDALIDMMRLARESMGDEGMLLYNGIRTLDRNGITSGHQYLPHADGVMVEHFTAFQSQTRESIAHDIEHITQAGKAGKLVVVKGWPDPDFNWTNRDKMQRPRAELAMEAQAKITFSLACFLIAAQEHSYFCYSWGYREHHGSLIAYPEFGRPLGNPIGDSVKEAWTYRRSFAHADVHVDLASRTARIDWKNK